MTNLVISFALCVLSINVSAQSKCDEFGQIQGRVVDEKQRPVSNAIVSLLHEECSLVGIEPNAITGADGSFTIVRVPAGRTGVYARKEDSGYPDTRALIYKDDSVDIPKVIVKSGETASDIIVKLGAQGGILLGRILDAETSLPVLTARVSLSRPSVADPLLSRGLDKTGGFRFVLPPRPVRLEVTAPGYEVWNYLETDQSTRGIIEIRTGQTKEITIRLHKIRKPE